MSNIRVIEKIGTELGNTLVVLAGIHGNEICGVKAFDDMISNLTIKSGKVYFIYANLEAIKQNKRFIDYNLNRLFKRKIPKEAFGSLEAKTAEEIAPYLRKADAMLDVHASFTPDSVPFVICDKKWIKISNIFNAKIASFNWDKFEPGSTDYFMNKQGKPGFCYECGFLKDATSTNKAKQAIKQFLIYYKCLSGKLTLKSNQRIIKIIGLYKNKYGVFRKSKYFKDFELLEKDTIIGKDGNKKIKVGKGKLIIFARDIDNLGEECFLIAKESNNRSRLT
ncbi:MAG: succinylglutamate desuccinylase/aspartoacylase family protein [Nanoarchaeota archaeon]